MNKFLERFGLTTAKKEKVESGDQLQTDTRAVLAQCGVRGTEVMIKRVIKGLGKNGVDNPNRMQIKVYIEQYKPELLAHQTKDDVMTVLAQHNVRGTEAMIDRVLKGLGESGVDNPNRMQIETYIDQHKAELLVHQTDHAGDPELDALIASLEKDNPHHDDAMAAK
jgi:hypothetical protein